MKTKVLHFLKNLRENKIEEGPQDYLVPTLACLSWSIVHMD